MWKFWMNYCYDYVTHDVFYDLDQEECDGTTQMWVVPNDNNGDQILIIFVMEHVL